MIIGKAISSIPPIVYDGVDRSVEWYKYSVQIAAVALVCKDWLHEVLRVVGPCAWFPIYYHIPRGLDYLEALSVMTPETIDDINPRRWALHRIIMDNDLESLLFVLKTNPGNKTKSVSYPKDAGACMLIRSDAVIDNYWSILGDYLQADYGSVNYTVLKIEAISCGKLEVAKSLSAESIGARQWAPNLVPDLNIGSYHVATSSGIMRFDSSGRDFLRAPSGPMISCGGIGISGNLRIGPPVTNWSHETTSGTIVTGTTIYA